MTRACLYARRSTSQEHLAAEQRSTSRQIELGRAFAVRQGWTVVLERADEARDRNFLFGAPAMRPAANRGAAWLSLDAGSRRPGRPTCARPVREVSAQSFVKAWAHVPGRHICLFSPPAYCGGADLKRGFAQAAASAEAGEAGERSCRAFADDRGCGRSGRAV